MLVLKLKKVHARNFKSLRDCKLELGTLNVLVGANASGKTNLVDLFILLRKIYAEKDINPFRYWWGYGNAVWNRDESLEISVRFTFDFVSEKRTHNVIFETTFTGVGGRFEILREMLEIKDILTLELEGGLLTVRHDEKYIDSIWDTIEELKTKMIHPYFMRKLKRIEKSDLFEQTTQLPYKSLFQLQPLYFRFLGHYCLTIIEPRHFEEQEGAFIITPIVEPLVYRRRTRVEPSLLAHILRNLEEWFSKIIILKLNIHEIKRPSTEKKETWLSEDGANLNAILYSLFLKEGRIPERIATIISYLFPEVNIMFSLTEDQRVYIKIREDTLELPPPNVSDGLYKVLAVLAALELKPSILVIDEIENSLHPRTLETILDEFKSSETMVIMTTHSPVVVDMTDPKDLVLVEKIAGETKFRRIKKPEEIKKKLHEAGITFSEGWLYGKL